MTVPLFSQHFTLGFRNDGRRPNETRNIDIKLSTIRNANGSAQFNIGNTSIIASVYGPQHPTNKESRDNRNKSTLIVKCVTASFSTTEHKNVSRNYYNDQLLSNTIKSTFNSIILNNLYPQSSIEIILEILQNDGSIISSAINATTLALIDAGISLKEYCVSCCVGYIDGYQIPFIDLNYEEQIYGTKNYKINQNKNQKNKIKLFKNASDDNQNNQNNQNNNDVCSGQLTLAIMPVTNKIITIQMGSIININKMQKLMQFCQKGCKEIHQIMKKAVKQHSFQLMQHRGFINR